MEEQESLEQSIKTLMRDNYCTVEEAKNYSRRINALHSLPAFISLEVNSCLQDDYGTMICTPEIVLGLGCAMTMITNRIGIKPESSKEIDYSPIGPRKFYDTLTGLSPRKRLCEFMQELFNEYDLADTYDNFGKFAIRKTLEKYPTPQKKTARYLKIIDAKNNFPLPPFNWNKMFSTHNYERVNKVLERDIYLETFPLTPKLRRMFREEKENDSVIQKAIINNYLTLVISPTGSFLNGIKRRRLTDNQKNLYGQIIDSLGYKIIRLNLSYNIQSTKKRNYSGKKVLSGINEELKFTKYLMTTIESREYYVKECIKQILHQ